MIWSRGRPDRAGTPWILWGLVALMFGGGCASNEGDSSTSPSGQEPASASVSPESAKGAPSSPASTPKSGAQEAPPSPTEGNDGAVIPTIERLPDPATIGDSPKGLINGAFAPELDLPDLASSERYRFSAHVGPEATLATRAAVVGFTASWCGPCKSSYPHLKKMQEQFGDDLEVVLVSMDEDAASREKHAGQVRAAGLDAPVLQPDEDTRRAWLGRHRNVPHFFIINKVGEILVQDRGFGKNVRRVLPKQIGYALRHPEYVVRTKKRK